MSSSTRSAFTWRTRRRRSASGRQATSGRWGTILITGGFNNCSRAWDCHKLPLMPNPLFSVIIPTFNRAEKLVRAIRSVIAQTVRDYEIIVIDDGTDQTRELLDQFGSVV